MTRKAFLGALLSQVTFAGLGGCGSYEALEELGAKELSFGGAEYWFLLAPEREPGRPFRAYVGASDENRLIKGPHDDLSQYLFKGRAWGPGEFGEYMGSGRDGEPCVDVNVMVPRDGDAASWAEAAEAAFAAMYGVGMSMQARVGVEGTDPYRSALRFPDLGEMFPATRRDPPTADRLAEDFELALTFDELYSTSWDGNGNPDGVPRDPSDDHSRATIEWFDGHGPDRW